MYTSVETNWDEIPAEYQYTAVSADGIKEAFIEKPEALTRSWFPSGGCSMFMGLVVAKGNWRESLRERPLGKTK